MEQNSKQEGIIFYIDGANAQASIREISRENTGTRYSGFRFNFPKIIETVRANKKVYPTKLVGVNYIYVPLESKNEGGLDSRQTNMVHNFEKLGWNCISARSKVKRDQSGVLHYQAKGDDVLLTMQAMEDLYTKNYDIATFMTGDEDFYPLIEEVKKKGKEVYLIYFKNQVSHDLAKLVGDDHSFCIDFNTLNKREYITRY